MPQTSEPGCCLPLAGASPTSNELRAILQQQRGHRLDSAVRRRMERCFAAEFHDVVIHISPCAADLVRRLGAWAFTIGNHICFAGGAYEPQSEDGLRLLAHELAHVVQQRLAGQSPGGHRPLDGLRLAIEAEADLAAAAAVQDRPFTCTISDDSGQPACWGLVGHYYTPYLIFLNAGVEKERAERLARWCWLADQVSELDAKTLGLNNYLGLDSNDTNRLSNQISYREGYERFGQYRFQDHAQYMRVIHKGIHVFTGGNAVAEGEYRAKEFLEMKGFGLLYQGLALHAYGDTFAHRGFDRKGSAMPRMLGPDGATLYSAGLGHFVDGEDADVIWVREHAGLYLDYVRQLSDLADKYSDQPAKVAVDSIIVALSAMCPVELRVYTGSSATDSRTQAAETKQQNEQINALKKIQNPGSIWDTFGGPEHRDLSPYVTWSKVRGEARQLATATIDKTEDACAVHIINTSARLLGIQMYKSLEERLRFRDPRRWSQYFRDNPELINDCDKAKYSETRATPDVDSVFCRILDHAVHWASVRGGETLDKGTPLRPLHSFTVDSQGRTRTIDANAALHERR